MSYGIKVSTFLGFYEPTEYVPTLITTYFVNGTSGNISTAATGYNSSNAIAYTNVGRLAINYNSTTISWVSNLNITMVDAPIYLLSKT
jgi:hypothetical protein